MSGNTRHTNTLQSGNTNSSANTNHRHNGAVGGAVGGGASGGRFTISTPPTPAASVVQPNIGFNLENQKDFPSLGAQPPRSRGNPINVSQPKTVQQSVVAVGAVGGGNQISASPAAPVLKSVEHVAKPAPVLKSVEHVAKPAPVQKSGSGDAVGEVCAVHRDLSLDEYPLLGSIPVA